MIRLENVLKTSLEDVLKMSWRRFCKTSWRRLGNVLKTSWRLMAKTNILVLIKTSSRRLQDVFWRRRQKTSSRSLQDVFIKTNVCWKVSKLFQLLCYESSFYVAQKREGNEKKEHLGVKKAILELKEIELQASYFLNGIVCFYFFPLFIISTFKWLLM